MRRLNERCQSRRFASRAIVRKLQEVNKSLQILFLRAMVEDCGADRGLTIKNCQGGRRFAPLMQFHHDFSRQSAMLATVFRAMSVSRPRK